MDESKCNSKGKNSLAKCDFPVFFFVGLARSASTSELSSIGGMVIIALCVIDQCLANMAGYWPRSFCVILNGGEVEVNKC